MTDSVLTACLGRYVASTCTYVDDPPESERCRGCVNATELEVTVVVDVDRIADTFGEIVADEMGGG